MGLLDDVLRAACGPEAGGDTNRNLATELLGMVSGGGASGGLTGLVNLFNQKGLGDVVGSWVSTGKNLPISPDQIQSVLGSAEVQALAAKVGIDPSRASAAIAQILPHLVDQATPDGRIPAGGGLLDTLSGFLRRT